MENNLSIKEMVAQKREEQIMRAERYRKQNEADRAYREAEVAKLLSDPEIAAANGKDFDLSDDEFVRSYVVYRLSGSVACGRWCARKSKDELRAKWAEYQRDLADRKRNPAASFVLAFWKLGLALAGLVKCGIAQLIFYGFWKSCWSGICKLCTCVGGAVVILFGLVLAILGVVIVTPVAFLFNLLCGRQSQEALL